MSTAGAGGGGGGGINVCSSSSGKHVSVLSLRNVFNNCASIEASFVLILHFYISGDLVRHIDRL